MESKIKQGYIEIDFSDILCLKNNQKGKGKIYLKKLLGK